MDGDSSAAALPSRTTQPSGRARYGDVGDQRVAANLFRRLDGRTWMSTMMRGESLRLLAVPPVGDATAKTPR
jgi:hypothetical protein